MDIRKKKAGKGAAMREYITREECEHCRQVKEIFSDYLEECRDTCVTDAYPFAYVVLECFSRKGGFDSQKCMYTAPELFECLMELWECRYLFLKGLENGTVERPYAEIQTSLTERQRREMEERRDHYIQKYEVCVGGWSDGL